MESSTPPAFVNGPHCLEAMPAVSAKRNSRRRGFTLVEAMIATVVFTFCTMGVYGMLIQSYKVSALGRARDNARAVLRTYADQFERLQTTVKVGGSPTARWLFWPESPSTGGVTGRGLSWGSLSDTDVVSNPIAPTPYLLVNIGTATNPLNAQITRDTAYVTDSSGAIGLQQIKAAGFLIRGTFSAKFTINGKDYTETLTVVRAVP